MKRRDLGSVMVAASAVHVAVRQLFAAGDTNFRHNAGEHQGLASQRMVAVNRDAFLGDASHGVDAAFARLFATAIELHADLDIGRKQSTWLDTHQAGLVAAKGVIWLEVHAARITRFLTLEGLLYAFPNAMAVELPQHELVSAHRERIAARPRIAAYLASPRRIPFNEMGIFRRYPELDAKPPRRARG